MPLDVNLPATIGRLDYSCEIFATDYGNVDLQNLATGAVSGLLNLLGASSFKNNSVRKWLSGGNMASQMAQVLLASTQTQNALGNATKISVRQKREMTRVYSIGDFQYEPSRLVQRKVTTSLTLGGVATYAGDTFARLGFPSWNIYTQQAPFIIRLRMFTPGAMKDRLRAIGANPDTIDLFFMDCWVSGNPIDFNAEGGKMVRQMLDIDCGRVICSDAQLLNTTSSINLGFKNFL